jgi:hypothetical protein
MELDDFKANWNTSQQAAINQQKLSTDKLDKLNHRITGNSKKE